MSKPWNWCCWGWKDHNGAIRYIGVGPFTDRGHPAKVKFENRDEDNSPLHLWLQTLGREPEREIFGQALIPEVTARNLCRVFRSVHKKTILDCRGPATRAGGGFGRCVAFLAEPDGADYRIFRSVREAGRWARVNPSTITRRCQSDDCAAWFYIEDPEEFSSEVA